MCGKDELLHDLRAAELAQERRAGLDREVVRAARRYVREGARLAATDPFEDALVAAVEQLEHWIADTERLPLKAVRAMHDEQARDRGHPTPAGPSEGAQHG